MKILAAFDSFKESISAYEAGLAVKRAAPDDDVIIKPMADGGEGTMEAMNASLKGTVHTISVTGPIFEAVRAKLAICGDLAVIEAAQACGLDLLEEDQKDGIHTSSYGVGTMIHYALDQGVKTILITLGGSATNDGGIGMLSALGIRFYDHNGHHVKPYGDALDQISKIDLSRYVLKDRDVKIIGACDVTNPLVGKKGASYVFGPQKGVKDVEKMDLKMKVYAAMTQLALGKDYQYEEGAGAAGGLGFAIVSYMGGTLAPGFDQVAKMTHLEEEIKACDLILTGEGSMDHQTLYGKTPLGVLRIAQKYNKKVIGFAGKLEDEAVLLDAGFDQVRCINHEKASLATLLSKGAENLEKEVRVTLQELKNASE